MERENETVKIGLAEWLAAGLIPIMRAGQIPPDLVSGQRCQRLMVAMGDSILVEAATGLGVGDGQTLYTLAAEIPDPGGVLAAEEAQSRAREWFERTQAVRVLRALRRVLPRVVAAFAEGKLPVEPLAIQRGLIVLGFLPWCPGGEELKAQLGAILGCSPGRPDLAIVEFASSVIKGDVQMVQKVDEVITSHPVWGSLSSRFLQEAQGLEPYGCRCTPMGDSEDRTAWDTLWDRLLD